VGASDEARSPAFLPEPVRSGVRTPVEPTGLLGPEPAPPSLSLFLAIAFLIFVWSLNYIVGKIALREIPALALGSFRLVTAGLVSLPVLFFLKAGKGRPETKLGVKVIPDITGKRSRRLHELWDITYLGFFGVVLNQGLFTVGLSYTSVSHSSLIIGCAPILILMFSWAMRLEALTRRKAIGMALAFAGVAVVGAEQAAGSTAGNLRGDVLTLLAGVGLALYTVLGKRAIVEYGAARVSLLSNISAAVLVSPIAVWQIRVLAHAGRLATIGLEGWGGVIYLGVLGTVVSYVLYFWVLRYMTPARLGAVSYLQPVGAILLGLVLLGEPITLRVAVGGLLIIAGVYAIETYAGDSQPEEEH
jgi:drug/metabolite transporter (DMT)-like permease